MTSNVLAALLGLSLLFYSFTLDQRAALIAVILTVLLFASMIREIRS